MPNKIVSPGFGTGSTFGIPVTIGVAPTSTLSITSSLVGLYQFSGFVAGLSLIQFSTSNGVTDTFTLISGAAQGIVALDGVSTAIVNTTTSVSIKAYAVV